MTRSEQREHERFALKRQPDAQLYLRTPAAHYRIRAVENVSTSGIRIALDCSVAAAERVAIEYRDAELKMEVNGIVAWCAPKVSATPSYVAGIRLFSPMLLAAMLEKP